LVRPRDGDHVDFVAVAHQRLAEFEHVRSDTTHHGKEINRNQAYFHGESGDGSETKRLFGGRTIEKQPGAVNVGRGQSQSSRHDGDGG
jgi:hypothetical protein